MHWDDRASAFFVFSTFYRDLDCSRKNAEIETAFVHLNLLNLEIFVAHWNCLRSVTASQDWILYLRHTSLNFFFTYLSTWYQSSKLLKFKPSIFLIIFFCKIAKESQIDRDNTTDDMPYMMHGTTIWWNNHNLSCNDIFHCTK